MPDDARQLGRVESVVGLLVHADFDGGGGRQLPREALACPCRRDIVEGAKEHEDGDRRLPWSDALASRIEGDGGPEGHGLAHRAERFENTAAAPRPPND